MKMKLPGKQLSGMMSCLDKTQGKMNPKNPKNAILFNVKISSFQLPF